jgi:hypothetical protein
MRAVPTADTGWHRFGGADQQECSQNAIVVACGRSRVGSGRQRGRSLVAVRRPQSDQQPHNRPLSCGSGGAPRGIRTPNRQIRSQPSPIPARPPGPFASPLVLVNGRVAGSSRASVPGCHVWHGRNVVAVSGLCRQTESLVTQRLGAVLEARAPDSSSGAPSLSARSARSTTRSTSALFYPVLP